MYPIHIIVYKLHIGYVILNNYFKRWINGYVNVEISGDNKERFVNLCTNNKLHIYRLEKYIEKDTEIYSLCIALEEYRNIKKIAHKTHTIPKIINKVGLPFEYGRLIRRKSFVIGLLLAIFIFYICSLFIWSIEIQGKNYYTDYELLKFLENNNIKQGIMVKNVVCKDIEDIIRKEYKDIGWVSAQIKGTRLIVSIKENVKFKKNIVSKKSRHIVAPEDGVIKSIIVKNGEPQVSVGSKVTKGQILVLGIMNIEDDSKTVIKKHAICSEANIIIEYNKEYYDRINRVYTDRIYTGKCKKKIGVILNNKKYLSSFTFYSIKKFDNFDVIVNNYNVSLGENIYLPVKILETDIREYKSVSSLYKDEELKKIAYKHFERYKEELKDDNITMVNSNIDYYINNKMLVGKGYVTLQDSNMRYKKVDKSELQVKGDEPNGNS